jgi:hypothetical protein
VLARAGRNRRTLRPRSPHFIEKADYFVDYQLADFEPFMSQICRVSDSTGSPGSILLPFRAS